MEIFLLFFDANNANFHEEFSLGAQWFESELFFI